MRYSDTILVHLLSNYIFSNKKEWGHNLCIFTSCHEDIWSPREVPHTAYSPAGRQVLYFMLHLLHPLENNDLYLLHKRLGELQNHSLHTCKEKK